MAFKPVLIFLGIVLVLLIVGNFTMPHGGTLWGNLFKHFRGEIKDEIEEIKRAPIERQLEEAKKAEFYLYLAKRFFGPVSYTTLGEAEGGWQQVRANGQAAYLDLETGLIFGGKTGPELPDWSADSLSAAKSRCQKLDPKGFWAVPTGFEMDLAYDHGILKWVPESRRRWIVHIVSFGGYEGAGLKAWSQAGGVSVRCVARTESVPAHGFVRDE